MTTQKSSFSPEQRSIIESAMAAEGIPGVAAAIVKNGELVAAGGFGYRKRDGKLPMTVHTVSPICCLWRGSGAQGFTSCDGKTEASRVS
ncbi:MAG: serine hydrolase [Candidatus Poribacteria bacterium]|nr:serine hydrolase [Candidatus Poribacteria bacterium]